MHAKKMIPAVLLLGAMLTAAVSCGSDGQTAADTTAAVGETQTVTETAAITEDAREPLSLGEADFGGEALRIMEYDFNTFVRYHDFAYSEDSAGELVNDAVFARNSMIEEHYNCFIESKIETDPVAVTRKFVTAGSNDYDVAELYINNAMTMAMEGMYMNPAIP